ncbi:MAG: DEAD/DEAH box helicase [Kofleriaceae bacterium]|nr:DEAD/DEAH box helicase [Myxococcales bacterium]MCB9560688.1 DEAD/DEAH box helicase [Kofleriaceae bacterium]
MSAQPWAGPGAQPASSRQFVPCLRVSTETLFVGGDEVVAAGLRLDFDYDGTVVRAGSRRSPIRRDALAESEARRLLEGLGAIELSCLDDCAAPPGVALDYVLRLDGDVHALCAFSAYSVPQLRKQGWRVTIDPEFRWQTVDAAAPMYVDVGGPGGQDRPDWFSIELGVEVDGHRVDLLPALLDLLDGAPSLESLGRMPRRCVAVKVDEKRWLPVPPPRLRMMLEVLKELYKDGKVGAPLSRAASLAQLGAALHDDERPVRWAGATQIRDLGYQLAMGPRPRPVALPSGLRADLRPYQREGVEWLQHLRTCDAGGILADDMGLGKTLQTIAHVLAEKEGGRLDKPAMIVTLTSLVGNWEREFAKFAPSLKVMGLRGPQRRARFPEIPNHDVVITTFPLVARDREELGAHEYHLLVLDEAHQIKNHQGQAHDAVRAIQARHRVCLTGTPIENNLGELWSLMDFLNPGMLGGPDEFRHLFRVPIEQHGEVARLTTLRERVRPYMLRRTKDAVAKDLPPKTEIVRAVDLGGDQRDLYESIRVAAHAEVRSHIRARGIGGSTIAILDALLKLRQVCCDPRLVTSEAARAVESSAKLDCLLELITQQLGQGRRLLVFSQFARMLGLISEALLGRGVGHVTLTGSTTDRQKPIDAFEAGRADVFLISLKAGGTGLNLTSADTVVHYDPWWNPAAQAQATDRAYRIGQKKPVFVYNLIAAGSVEDRMLALQQHKRRLADAILAADGAAATKLTERDIDDLLAPLE